MFFSFSFLNIENSCSSNKEEEIKEDCKPKRKKPGTVKKKVQPLHMDNQSIYVIISLFHLLLQLTFQQQFCTIRHHNFISKPNFLFFSFKFLFMLFMCVCFAYAYYFKCKFFFCFCFFENEKTILFYLLLLYFLDVPYFPITIGTLTIYDLGEVRNFVMVKCFSFNLSCE